MCRPGWQVVQENADSRVWVGYHVRRASEVGLFHRREVAKLVMERGSGRAEHRSGPTS